MYNLYFRLQNTKQHTYTVFGSIDKGAYSIVRYSTRVYNKVYHDSWHTIILPNVAQYGKSILGYLTISSV